MKFLKKNWLKIIIAAVLLAGSIFMLLPLIAYSAESAGFTLAGLGDVVESLQVALAGIGAAAQQGQDGLSTIGGILTAVAGGSGVAIDKTYALAFLFSYIAGLIFFLSALTCIILSMFEKTKKFSKWIMICAGTLATIAMITAIICSSTSDTADALKEMLKSDDAETKSRATFMLYDRLSTLVTYLFVFGLLPICYGAKKLLKKCCHCKDHEEVKAAAK